MSTEGIRKNPIPRSWGSFDLVVEMENEQQTNKYVLQSMLSVKMEINRVMGQRMKKGADMRRARKWLPG